MTSDSSPIQQLRTRLSRGDLTPREAAATALACANSNAGRNVYLALDPDWALAEAAALPARFPAHVERPLLYGLPVSLKDCFDLAGFPTTCGSRFYARRNGLAANDSWLAAKLQAQGAVITGKTHLHQLAYGITGENQEYGDCLQPRNAKWLTGGSSSGAAASVQEGSAVAAIGTDTGGSIRAPAALCSLAGYRASLGIGSWYGAAHLAPSFDTMGFLFRDLRDGPLLAQAVFDLPPEEVLPPQQLKVGAVSPGFLHDCEPFVLQAFQSFQADLRKLGVSVESFDPHAWNDSFEIFAPIQASEAAAIHAGHFHHFEPAIAERLEWGASIGPEHIAELRVRHKIFSRNLDRLFDTCDVLLLPCAPVSSLEAGADQSAARKSILRYTTPASLAGTPVVTIPLPGAGIQLIGRHGRDSRLLAFAAAIAALQAQ